MVSIAEVVRVNKSRKIYEFKSCCSGRNCGVAVKCGRLRRRGNLVFNGPLLDMYGDSGCQKFVKRKPAHGFDDAMPDISE